MPGKRKPHPAVTKLHEDAKAYKPYLENAMSESEVAKSQKKMFAKQRKEQKKQKKEQEKLKKQEDKLYQGVIKARDSLKAETKRFRENLESDLKKQVISNIKKKMEDLSVEIVDYQNDYNEKKIDYNPAIHIANRQTQLQNLNKLLTNIKSQNTSFTIPTLIQESYKSNNFSRKYGIELTGLLGEQYVVLRKLEANFLKDYNDPTKQISNFENDFNTNGKVFPREKNGIKYAKNIAHILASVVTLGAYAGVRALHSQRTRHSPAFWKSREVLLAEKLDKAGMKAEIKEKKSRRTPTNLP